MRAALRATQVAIIAVGAHGYALIMANIPNGDKVKSCIGEVAGDIGHITTVGRGPRNQFGKDFEAEGNTWTHALCRLDSDGDGRTNGEELGDPDCEWSKGQTPQFVDGITHPGQNCDDKFLAAADEPAPGIDRATMIFFHGIAMITAWGLLLPVGSFAAIFWRKAFGEPLWFKVHMTLQTIGLLVFLSGFVFTSLGAYGNDSPHKTSGSVFSVLALLQGIGGVCRPHKPTEGEQPSCRRTSFQISHRLLGKCLVLYGLMQVAGGIFYYEELYNVKPNLLLGVFGVLVAASLLFGFQGWLRGRRQTSGMLEKNGEVEL